MNQKQLQKEWLKMEKAEAAYLKRGLSKEHGFIQEKISEHVPDKLEGVLRDAFYKAFQIVFDKGTFVIEKPVIRRKKSRIIKYKNMRQS